MTDWTCPECEGGFPEFDLGTFWRLDRCPWCGHPMSGLDDMVEERQREREEEKNEGGIMPWNR